MVSFPGLGSMAFLIVSVCGEAIPSMGFGLLRLTAETSPEREGKFRGHKSATASEFEFVAGD
jgi:hypothetical protein